MFLLDTSSGVGRENFDKMKVFMKNIISSFDIDNQMTRVGILTYDVDARIDIKLSDYNNKAALFERIDRLPYYSGELTRIDRALMMVSNTAFSEENGGRKDRNKVLNLLKYTFLINQHTNLIFSGYARFNFHDQVNLLFSKNCLWTKFYFLFGDTRQLTISV